MRIDAAVCALTEFLQIWQLMDLPPHAEDRWEGRLVQRTLFEAGVHLVDMAMTSLAKRQSASRPPPTKLSARPRTRSSS